MAARKNKLHDPQTIERIRATVNTSQLVKALSEHAIGAREMVASQVTAGLGLLKKVLPDLESVTMEHSGEIKTRHDISDQPPSSEEWQSLYGERPAKSNGHSGNGHRLATPDGTAKGPGGLPGS